MLEVHTSPDGHHRHYRRRLRHGRIGFRRVERDRLLGITPNGSKRRPALGSAIYDPTTWSPTLIGDSMITASNPWRNREEVGRVVFPVRLSMVTYNLWGTERWPEREPAIRLFFERYQPDVLCVQELTLETRQLLDDILSDHGRVEDPFIGWMTEGNIWWNHDLFQLVEYGAEEFGIEAYPDRRLFWTRLQVVDRPTTLFVGDIHLSDAGLHSELEGGCNSRVREIKEIIETLGRLVDDREAAFLLGDYNDSLAPLAHLLLAGFDSCWAKLHQIPPPTMPAYPDRLLGSGFASSFVLDWIVANRNARPLSASSPHVYAGHVAASDHWPVHAVYELIDH